MGVIRVFLLAFVGAIAARALVAGAAFVAWWAVGATFAGDEGLRIIAATVAVFATAVAVGAAAGHLTLKG